MAFKMAGWSAFKNKDDDKMKKLRELRDRYIKGNKSTRDSIINLPIIQKELKKGKSPLTTDDKKNFSDTTKYKKIRDGRTGGIVQNIKSGKFFNTAFGHEMDSVQVKNPFDPNIVDVKWFKKEK